MVDRAHSDDPRVQRQLDRLNSMTPGRDILGRDRLRKLLSNLGHPERALPPVFHVAGTNGKGSTCTYLREIIAASSKRVHVYTSPHLVRLNERIRVANRLISDQYLAGMLEETLDALQGAQTTFFEATTAAAFLAFSRVPADACIIEVGIGGRLDATNVIPDAAVCGIAQLGIDHQTFLGDTLESIASEKAGIAKTGTPLIVQAYQPRVLARIEEAARDAGASLLVQDRDWFATWQGVGIMYVDQQGELALPPPALAGDHQLANAGLAVAMLRNQAAVFTNDAAMARGLTTARWPARLSRLGPGPITAALPKQARIWLDGAHNPAAMTAVVRYMAQQVHKDQTIYVLLGLLRDKDMAGILKCFADIPTRFYAVPIAEHACWSPQELADAGRAQGHVVNVANTLREGVHAMAQTISGIVSPAVLMTGSLYLAGEVLAANNEFPT